MDSCGFQPRTPESSAPVSVLSVETGAPQRSRYNYFVDRPDGLVMGYNARTGTFAIIATTSPKSSVAKDRSTESAT